MRQYSEIFPLILAVARLLRNKSHLEPEAQRVATALELYCTGSLNHFNHPTNVKTDSRVVCVVLKNMGENLRKIAMHICCLSALFE